MNPGVAIVGAAGYAGQELVRFVCAHPDLELVGLYGSNEAPVPLARRCPNLRGLTELPIEPTGADAIVEAGAQVALLAAPHELSAELAPELLESDVAVVDLSAAFRLPDASLYPEHYGFAHPHPDLLARAVYGVPELFREQMYGADLIAAAGCYPTSSIIPLRPLVAAGLLDVSEQPIINSVSGISGAGRKAVESSLLCEVSLKPYGVLSHRHGPEIDTYAGASCLFVPHVAPFARGIVSTIHAKLAPGMHENDVRGALSCAYADEPFVRLLGPGEWPSVGAVEHTNFIDIALTVRGDRLVLVGAIDNLVKGAAGQAVQCLNISLGLAESAGLPLPRAAAEVAL